MPTVTIIRNALDSVSRPMPTPRKVAELTAWFRGARAVIPSIPDPAKSDWFFKTSRLNLTEVRFDLYNALGHTVTVRIEKITGVYKS